MANLTRMKAVEVNVTGINGQLAKEAKNGIDHVMFGLTF
jgi:hypothetical protein